MGKQGLAILHVDGLSYRYLLKALEQGGMPFVKHLVDEEGYEVLRYRCGIPSTTPFAQAGILYGDNSEIPSFRWWDKQSGLEVSFGGMSTFKHVAHRYFGGSDPLVRDGASIATCFPSAAAATYRLAYREHGYSMNRPPFSQKRALANWALNPLHLLDWTWRGLLQIWKANLQYWRTLLSGRPAAKMYIVSDMLEEILLHQLTRFATVEAMQEGYASIYAAFYAYDETAHAFGPESDYSFRILRHIDNTIRRIAANRQGKADGRDYELVILSDHGQVETVPFDRQYGHRLGEIVSEWLPTFEVEELKGKRFTPKAAIDGHILLTFSGGLAHWYFKDISWRLGYDEIEERFPGLVAKVAGTPGIGFVLLRNGDENHILTSEAHFRFDADGKLPRGARDFLARYDEPDVLACQLDRLNSFHRSGDIILFGEYLDDHQVNFENQVGGHGSVGGEQLFPFILAKREWKFNTADVIGSYQLYPLLKRLKDKLVVPGMG